MQNDVAEIKLRAERRIGKISRELPAIGHRPKAHHDGKLIIPKTEILKEAGISHAERYEAMASLPDEVFERHIAK